MPWSDDRIRVIFFSGVKYRLIGKIIDERKFNLTKYSSIYPQSTTLLKYENELQDTEEMNFDRSPNYR